jgi:2-polyprenyl-3-methyl-5-hydroxy-6-metoxy-1,4-benzoquinol methylase
MKRDELNQDIIGWDVVNWAKILEFWKENTSLDLANVKALEVGSYHGGLSLWAALQGARVECTDINSPEIIALPKHKKYGVEHLIKYSSLDVLNIPDKEKYDVVLFKSVLGGLGLEETGKRQAQALEQIYKVLKPGGELYFAENLNASRFHQLTRKVFLHRDKVWRYITKQEMLNWTQNYKNIVMISYGFAGAFGRNEYQRKWLGWLDQYLFNRIVPARWHYILAGIAKVPLS